MESCCECGRMRKRPEAAVCNVHETAVRNRNFRTEVWTGNNLQLTVMSIPLRGDIGWEIHEDTDQMIRVEQGRAVVQVGKCRGQREYQRTLQCSDAVLVPAGTWHNLVNTGNGPLKVSSIYAPPHHPKGTVHHTKEDAEHGECEM